MRKRRKTPALKYEIRLFDLQDKKNQAPGIVHIQARTAKQARTKALKVTGANKTKNHTEWHFSPSLSYYELHYDFDKKAAIHRYKIILKEIQ